MIIPSKEAPKTESQTLDERVDAIQDKLQQILNILGNDFRGQIEKLRIIERPTSQDVDNLYKELLEQVSIGFLLRQVVNKTLGRVDTHIRKNRSISLLTTAEAINSVENNAIKQISNIAMALTHLDKDVDNIDFSAEELDAIGVMSIALHKMKKITEEELGEIMSILTSISETLKDSMENDE